MGSQGCIQRFIELILRFLHIATKHTEGTCNGLDKETKFS